MQIDFETLISAAATFFGFVSLACIPLVLMRRKEASSAIAWILVLVFVPLVGVFLFWFLGRDRVRRPARVKLTTNVTMRDRLSSLRILVRRPDSQRLLDEKRVPKPGVMALASRVTRMEASPGNQVEVLVGTRAAYEAQLEAITRARDHIHIELYIFRPDAEGRKFVDALVAAQERGVRVRLLVDGFGSRGLRLHRATAALRKSGARIGVFLPLDPIRRAWTVNLRNHRKLMVVDGEEGFTGGINVGEEFVLWRDVHLRIRGPAAHQLQSIFIEDWYFATRHNLADPVFFADVPEAGDSIVQIVESGPDATVESIHRLYFAAIASARERVLLTTPYFVPDRALLVALQTAALRGVDVRLILPRRSNHRVTFHAGRSFYEELLEAGVKIHEYTAGMVHAKTMIVDGTFATVGSANLDVRSFRLNFELIAVLWDRGSVSRLEAIFREDLERTVPVDLDAWRRRGYVLRLKEGVGRLCAPLL